MKTNIKFKIQQILNEIEYHDKKYHGEDNPEISDYEYDRLCSDYDKLIEENFELNSNEKKIIRKIFEWPKIVETASFKHEPHRIPYYLYELATLFHAYWSKGNENQNFKFIEDGEIKSEGTLITIVLISIVIQRGMGILGVSLPDKM